MKIWLPTIQAGSGADIFTMRLAEGLKKFGHEPIIEWFEHHYEIAPFLLRSKKAPCGTDIIHAGSWSGFAFKRKGIPLVITDHNYIRHPEFLRYKGLMQSAYHNLLISRYVDLSFKSADALVSVSNHNADAIRQHFRNRVEVIHNWVDTEFFCPDSRQGDCRIKKPFRLLYVGNPSKWKGSDLLPHLVKKFPPDVELLCLGGLRSEANIKGGGSFRVLRRHLPSEMPGLYRSVDAVLVLSRHESFGYVALEAMSCGVPVIGFDVSGTAEVCRGADCSILVEDGNLDRLLDAIKMASSDIRLCNLMGRNGRKTALEAFSDENIQKYVRLYSSLINF